MKTNDVIGFISKNGPNISFLSGFVNFTIYHDLILHCGKFVRAVTLGVKFYGDSVLPFDIKAMSRSGKNIKFSYEQEMHELLSYE